MMAMRNYEHFGERTRKNSNIFPQHFPPQGKLGYAITLHKQKNRYFCLALCSACTNFVTFAAAIHNGDKRKQQ